jgi:putative transposase
MRESHPGETRKGFFQMKRTRHTTEQVIEKLRQADLALGKGQKVPEVCKQLAITEQTYYRWRQKYGGMAPEMVKQLRVLEKENARLKKLVAEQALDMEILKEAAKGNW